MSFRALVEKSPATETGTIVHVMRRDEGVPPYRRLRRRKASPQGGSLNRLRTRTPPCHCERSVAISWKRNAASELAPAHSPVAARHRGNLVEGKTDETYTDVIPLPWGISPLRSDYRPHFGRNDIKK